MILNKQNHPDSNKDNQNHEDFGIQPTVGGEGSPMFDNFFLSSPNVLGSAIDVLVNSEKGGGGRERRKLIFSKWEKKIILK